MDKFLKQLDNLIPVVILAVTLLSCFISINYVVVGNLIGYSLVVNIFIFQHYFITFKKYPFITKASVLALPFINILNILGYYFLTFNKYKYIYTTLIVGFVVCLTIINLCRYKK